ncbi:MAG TPA: hypothetical protein VD846_12490 [Allosphingosinicella sp.]|nr:hypothetical protein [Allosphingosinicella sp.]
MKKLIVAAAALVALTTTAGCKMPAKYECIVKDAKTGEVIKKYKVAFKEECQAFAL